MATGQVKRESYFMRFRKRWKRRGVIEIGEDHPKHLFTTYVRQGLQDSIEATNNWKNGVNKNEFTGDIRSRLFSTTDGTKFDFVTYAPQVFASLRDQSGFSTTSYQECVSPIENDVKYLEFVSNSKSGQNFFLSNDKQLMIKTHTSSEKKFFLKVLPKYIEHLKRYPHTLLVRYLGLYKITINQHDPVYFVVMQSILFPDERISLRFDLKACEAGRFTQEQTEPSEVISVLKDVNFGGRKLYLGSQSSWFCLQIQHDTEFLRGLRVIDYSLLVGLQTLHLEEMKETSDLASIIVRTQKSTSRKHSVRRHWAQSPTKTMALISEESAASKNSSADNAQESVHLPGAVDQDGESTSIQTNSTLSPQKHSLSTQGRQDSLFSEAQESVTESESLMQNRRLLPHCRNELHVIDGVNHERYFVGIIDFFTPFGIKKKVESLYKAVKFKKSGLSYSTVHPDAYADRFRDFVSNHVG